MAVKRVQNPAGGAVEARLLPMCWCCCCGSAESTDLKRLEAWADLLASTSSDLKKTARSLASQQRKGGSR